ncbi:phytoene desaturase family protein, partial [Acidisphaera rubrifaciens]|uniref:phytoene desaturase family protein n=1 Tax=Acidisphaera rubrifaciens TaxID=50715 RepID=UPI001F525E3D
MSQPRTTLPRRVVVIGAGMGGLAATLLLAAAGHHVTVLERADAPGGKVRQVAIGDALLDAGPTVFTMRWVFDALFEAAGTRLEEHLTLRPASVLARHAWNATERLDLYADINRSAAAIEAFAGPAEARGYRAFCARARDVYATLEQPFISGARPTPLSLAASTGLGGLSRISPFATLWRALGDHFHDPRLQQLFGRYATYCGASPFLAPATLMLVAHVEQAGVWLVDGGMHALARALAARAEALGATLRLGADVASIQAEGGQVRGVVLADGTALAADAVVANA